MNLLPDKNINNTWFLKTLDFFYSFVYVYIDSSTINKESGYS